jgi:DNA polymerase sigma
VPATTDAILNDHLERVVLSVVPSKLDTEHLWACLGELSLALAELGQMWRLGPFGSVKNLFMTRGSDIDVSLYRVDAQGEGNSAAAVQVLQIVMELLSQRPRLEVLRFIATARIPVLTLRFNGLVDVDLSCHNTEPLRNTQLLRAYAEAGPLVRGLALLVKLWSKAANVCGAPKGNLTSYSLTLLALFFLQVHPDFELPCLPTWAFNGSGPTPQQGKVRWRCGASLLDALRKFFEFYARDFDWGNEVVSVRLGRRLSTRAAEFVVLKDRDQMRLHVEDPYLLGRNLNCVLGLQQEIHLQSAVRDADATMRGGDLPHGLRAVPFSAADSAATAAHV